MAVCRYQSMVLHDAGIGSLQIISAWASVSALELAMRGTRKTSRLKEEDMSFFFQVLTWVSHLLLVPVRMPSLMVPHPRGSSSFQSQ